MYQAQFPQMPPMPYGPQGMGQFMGSQQFRFGQTPQPQRSPLQNVELYQVTSVDEAKAAMVNPLGMTAFFNFPGNEIYIKRIGNDGRGEMYTFQLVQPAQDGQQQADPLSIINQRLANIETAIGGLTNVQRNAEPAAVSGAIPAAAATSATSRSTADDAGVGPSSS